MLENSELEASCLAISGADVKSHLIDGTASTGSNVGLFAATRWQRLLGPRDDAGGQVKFVDSTYGLSCVLDAIAQMSQRFHALG